MSVCRFRVLAALVATLVVASLSVAAGTAWARPTRAPPPPVMTPDTSDCPNRKAPPPLPALVEAFGGQIPPPLPVPEEPIGGPAMGQCGIVLPEGAPPPPRGITAASWIIADVDTGQVLAAKDPHGRYRPASTIKLLTALLAVQQLEPNQVITATPADVAVPGSSAGLVAGGRYTVQQLLAGLLLQSGNGIAHALARAMGGIAETVREMTLLARELGAYDTRVTTPSGLDAPGMSTSAYDLALITRDVLNRSFLSRVLRTERVLFPGGPKGEPYVLSNDNGLLGNYPGAIGGKLGYTDAAEHTYVGIAARDGRRLVTVLLHGDDDPIPIWRQGAKLLSYGFSLPTDASVGRLVEPSGSGGRDAAAPGPAGLPSTLPLPEPEPEPLAAIGSSAMSEGALPDQQTGSRALVGWLLVGAAAAVALLGLFARQRRAS